MAARVVHHLFAALFCAAIGVVLGAATCGRFEALVVFPSLVAASLFVLVAFALLARSARRRLGGGVVCGLPVEPEHAAKHDLADGQKPIVGA